MLNSYHVKNKFETIGNYKYSILPIGQGSFSTVYQGENIVNHKKVAIKKINITFNNNLTKDKIESEIKIMKKLDHKHIVKLYDTIYDDFNNVYIIMEYCECGNLGNFLDKKPLKEKYIKHFMKQIASATRYLIKNKILHRDLKPQNIMMTDPKTIKITDFGFAKIFQSDDDIMSQTICGSPIYMAPEIVKRNHYSIKTDLWSIGVILYEMVTGKPPYKASSHLELLHKIDCEPIYIPVAILISDECRNLIYDLLQKNPDKRISWLDFFDHPWFKNNIVESEHNIDLSELIVDYDYKPPESERKIQELRVPLDVNHSFTTTKSKPIAINKPENTQIEEEIFNDSYTSPMFNTPLIFTPNDKNGYIIVEPDIDDDDHLNCHHDSENNEIKKDDDHWLNSERTISESFMDYMNDTINYYKTYYWQ